jgi:predicted permease
MMRRARAWLSRFRGLFAGAERDRELSAELESHLAMHIEDNLRAGMDPAEARRQALLRLGGLEQTKESYRDQRSLPWLETLRQDFRFGVRILRRDPGFTLVAVLTLGLGIGATTAMFSVVNGVLLQPLPYRQPERLVRIFETAAHFGTTSVAYLNFRDWQRASRWFEAMAGFRNEDLNLTGLGDPEYLRTEQVSADFFPVLGISPMLGRAFSQQDDRPGGPPVAVVTYGFWQQRLGGDPNVLGRALTLGGRQYAIIGVLRPDYRFQRTAPVYLPLAQAEPSLLNDRSQRPGLAVLARLRRGATLAQANSELQAVARELASKYPDANGGCGALAVPLKDDLVGGSRPTLYLLLGAVSLVLLIACANVASLLLARSAGRSREFAVRVALGARRSRLVRQLLAESLLLALAAGALGMACAAAGTQAVLKRLPETLPRAQEVGVDARVLSFALAASLLTALLFGLAPLLVGTRSEVQGALKEGGRGASTRHRAQSVFVAGEFAVAVTLLIGAGLMVRTLSRLWSVDPGFEAKHALTMQVALAPPSLKTAAGIRLAFAQLLDRVRGLAGVQAAAVTSLVPLGDADSEIDYWMSTSPAPPAEQRAAAMFYVTSPGYLEALRIPLLRGRYFDERDTTSSPRVVVVDDVFERERFGAQGAVGQRISLQVVGTVQIVGVVGHVKHWGLDKDATARAAREEIYFPVDQVPDEFMRQAASGLWVVVRTDADPLSMVTAIRGQVMGSNRDQPVFHVATMEQVISESLARRRFAMFLLGTFAAIAVLLAATGAYGVISYSVAQRAHEIGIRMALGAGRADVVRMVLRQGLALCLGGVAAGFVTALAATRLLASLLYGVHPADLLTFATVALMLGAVALVASCLPAWRATRVDPMQALRDE